MEPIKPQYPTTQTDPSTLQLKRMVYASLMAALTAAGAYIAIPVGPVPIVLQNLFVMLAGLLLGGRWGLISIGVYLLAGAVGLPVFAGGTGGVGKFVGPTGGYLLGFVAAAYLIGVFSERGRGRVVVDILAMTAGTIVIYAFGVTWLKMVTGMSFSKAVAVGMLPFLIGDALKIAVAIPIARALRPMIDGSLRAAQAAG
ncbi:MAG: BioY family transporter [Proteobacteria bacterium]|nr:MAG: BioY family transporter [Pseudomonadota bacterium]PIE68093.1 MAG: BioY family transporter [Deltaproteobacteria bacterium]